MAELDLLGSRLSDRDLNFVVEAAAPDFSDKAKLKRLIVEDKDFRKGLVGDERVFRKVMEDEDAIVRISPALYFEILLRKTFKELGHAHFTVERAGTQAVPVFDTKEVVDLLARQPVIEYLSDMLSSFTKIESYAIPIRVKKGVWRRIRFNDMDIDSLIKFCDSTDEKHRFAYYKRIADVCLFILGVFPEYAHFDYRYPSSGEMRPEVPGRIRRGLQDYEEEGRRFYKLAAQHETARASKLVEVFTLLYENFNAARKPLGFISEHYLHYKKQELFPMGTS